MPQTRHNSAKFEPKDLVLAKMHGFPAWPSFVMPLSLVPDHILLAKKKTTNFCVIFIPDGDFYWMNEKNLDALPRETLDKKISKIPSRHTKKKGTGRTLHVNDALLAARYLNFDDFMKHLNMGASKEEAVIEEELAEDESERSVEDEHVGVVKEEGEAKEEKEEEDNEGNGVEVRKAIKSRRDRVDDGDIGDEEDEVDEDVDDAFSARRARRLKRVLSEPQATTSKRGRASVQPQTPPPNGKKAEASPPKVVTTEEKQHQLWLCRIKLQRMLIQRNQPVTPPDPRQFPPPTAEELLVARLILNRLSDFVMTVDFLRSTKIHKVLKCILRNSDLEYPDSFKLHEKCHELLYSWASIIEELKREKLSDERSKNSSNNEDSEVSGIDTSLPLKNGVVGDEKPHKVSAKT
jgi:hypothetical protein